MTEKEKYLQRFSEKKANGLISMHFTTKGSEAIVDWEAEEEKIYAELNRMDEAPSLPDPELFPNGTKFF